MEYRGLDYKDSVNSNEIRDKSFGKYTSSLDLSLFNMTVLLKMKSHGFFSQ